jgi:DNA replication protein DnaC
MKRTLRPAVSPGPSKTGDAVKDAIDKLSSRRVTPPWFRMTHEERQAADPERFARDEAEWAAVEVQRTTEKLQRLDHQLGSRYVGATLESYVTTCDAQRVVLSALRDYADNMLAYGREGRGIVLYGSCGTGKDHLAGSLARIAISRYRVSLEWIRGVDLYARFRDAIRNDASENEIIAPLVKVAVLAISDPLPPVGALTEFQAAALLRIVDERYRRLRPIWTTINVASGEEADRRLGAQVADRLRDGALTLFCDWPSYRKAATQARKAAA